MPRPWSLDALRLAGPNRVNALQLLGPVMELAPDKTECQLKQSFSAKKTLTGGSFRFRSRVKELKMMIAHQLLIRLTRMTENTKRTSQSKNPIYICNKIP